MALIRHQNIKVLENALNWHKNGVLQFISQRIQTWIGSVNESNVAPLRPLPVPIRRKF